MVPVSLILNITWNKAILNTWVDGTCELSLEETLSDFKERNDRPANIEDKIWKLIMRGEPFIDGELVDLENYSRENIANCDSMA